MILFGELTFPVDEKVKEGTAKRRAKEYKY